MLASITRRGDDGSIRHHLALLIISSCLLPLSIAVAGSFYLVLLVNSIFHALPIISRKAIDPKERILITGDDQATTLAFARLANHADSKVFVVDNELFPLLNCLRYSNSVSNFIATLPYPFLPKLQGYIARLLSLLPFLRVSVPARQEFASRKFPEIVLSQVLNEKITLWIPCEAPGDDARYTSRAKDNVKSQTTCNIFGPTTNTLRLSKDFRAFSEHVMQLETRIQCAKNVTVTSRVEIHDVLADAVKGRQFRLEKAENRRHSGYSGTTLDEADEHTLIEPGQDYRILPLGDSSETYNSVAMIHIAKDQPWNVYEQINGSPIVASALVVNNSIRAFVACVSSETRTTFAGEELQASESGAWDLLDSHSVVASNLLEFTANFAEKLPEHTSTNLNLHFILSASGTPTGIVQYIYATGCDFKASPLLAQLAHGSRPAIKPSFFTNKVDTTLFPKANQLGERQTGVYSFPVVLLDMVVMPALNCLLLRTSFAEVLKGLATLLDRVAYWQEELLDKKDPWPWVWHWFVEEPCGILLGEVGFWTKTYVTK
jgi:hypothetical protein